VAILRASSAFFIYDYIIALAIVELSMLYSSMDTCSPKEGAYGMSEKGAAHILVHRTNIQFTCCHNLFPKHQTFAL
jgi:hypothetical protein